MPTPPLPHQLFLSQQVREIDHSAIHRHGIPGFTLMTKAAQFSFNILCKNYPETRNIIVLCGSGNNAGDGYIVAALAKKHGLSVKVYFLSPPEGLKGDAQLAYQQALSEEVICRAYSQNCLSKEGNENSLIVDALLGTGLNSSVRGAYAEAIQEANSLNAPILAIDIPSGLSADSGSVLGTAIEADCTTTFIALKLGLFTGEGRNYCGEIFYDDLNVPSGVIIEQAPVATKLSIADQLKLISQRPRHAHKGNCGHTLIIGGEKGYGGAVIMAAEAALRSGSGLTSVITHQDNYSALLSRTPEVMVTPAHDTEQVEHLIAAATAIVIGPGLGQSAWSELMLQKVIHLDKPLILDADALNILSRKGAWLKGCSAELRRKRVYTPHPGEASRILSSESCEVQKDRLASINKLADILGGHILLKGSGSLIISPEKRVHLCPYGNPGMASGGMGDVLSGVIGALVAQGYDLDFSLRLAVSIHAYAADLAALADGERGLCATDLLPFIRKTLNKL